MEFDISSGLGFTKQASKQIIFFLFSHHIPYLILLRTSFLPSLTKKKKYSR